MRLMLQAGVVAGVIGVLAMPSTQARAQADFYKGKTVSIVIGAKTGSLFIAAQLVGRHLGKHIPGNPTVITRQMPGGAHLNATNNIFNVAEADGLSILAANPNVAMGQLAKLPNVRFDASKFIWLGSSGPDGSMFAIRAALPFKTFQEMKDSGKEFVAGTTGPGSNAHDMPLLLKEFAGLKIRLVAGYAANSDILLAVRGIPHSIGRAFAVRPGTPPDRVAMLRDAIAKTVQDPAFIEEAKKAKIHTEYISADAVTKMFGELLNQPPQVLEAMNKYLKVGE
jgi:tripartite-type tricarboxylate transporter receptor subunit TctC